MNTAKKFLSAVFIALFLSASEIYAQETQNGAEDISMEIQKNLKLPPLTAIDVIENIKAVSASDFFLSDFFRNKENLIKFCNGKSIETLGKDEDYLIIRGIDIKGVDGSSMDFVRRERNGKPAAGIKINFYSPLITVDYLVSIFGPFEKIVDPYKNYNTRHPALLKPKTHQYGNMEVHYLIRSEIAATEIIFLTTGDGSISRFNAIQTRR